MKRLLRNLAVSLMAFLICMSVLHVQVKAASPTDGTAYGVLLDTGELLLIRSEDEISDTGEYDITDIYGNPYHGTVFPQVENGVFLWAGKYLPIKSFRVAEDFIVKPSCLDYMFYGCEQLETVSLERVDISLTTEMDGMFNGCNSLKNVTFPADMDTSKVVNFEYMFCNCYNLETIDLSAFDFSAVKSLSCMFNACYALKDIKFPKTLDVSKVEDFTSMFYHCDSLTELDLSSFNTVSAVNMNSMFSYCEKLKKLDISSFDTRNTTENGVIYMLGGLSKLEEIKLGKYFVNWNEIGLENGRWKNGSLIKTSEELISEYSSNAATWAGTWTREFDMIERLELSGYKPLMPGDASVIYFWTEPSNVKTDFIWSSSDESVLTVDENGTVYAQKVGEAVITARTTDGSNIEAKITVKVREDIAYGILSDDGELVLIRSKEKHETSPEEKVTVKGSDGKDYTGYVIGDIESDSPDWFNWTAERGVFIDSVKKLCIAEGFTIEPDDINWWLSGADMLEEVDLTGINTKRLTAFGAIFFEDKSLKKVNLGTMDTSSAEDMWDIFEGCSVIEEITFGESFTKYAGTLGLPVGNWTNGSVTYAADEFDKHFAESTEGLAGTWTRQLILAATFDITEDVIEIEAENGGEIPYVYTPDEATISIEWTSSDPDGLYVWPAGNFWAYTPGEYIVTGHTREGSDLTDTVKIIVTPKRYITKLDILEDEIMIEVNTSGNIPYEYTPSDLDPYIISWTSNNPDGLEVWTNGYFEAYAVGEYTVTAHTTDGSDLSDTIKIHVVERGTIPYDPSLYRIFGSNRYKTGFAIAEQVCSFWPDNKCDYFVVACGNNFADALAGSYLAAVKMAPILLINDDKAQEVADFIKERISKNGTIYILGGPAAVSSKAESILKKVGKIKRLQGSNRYATNLEIIKEAGMDVGAILVATGTNYADSLSASATGLPILLVKNSLDDTQKEFLNKYKGKKIYVIGGENAVSKAIETELKKYGEVKRIAGTNRVDTSVKIAQTFFNEPLFDVVAYSHDFADGLCGGPFAYMIGAPLLLTREENKDITQKYIDKQYHINGICLGGTARITDKVLRKLFSASSSIEINKLEWK
ncbi:MAG: cell wall-binding repeat-containing protein [Erysipelotrichaceae bacterium]|nr:cell wall-binding repeat-containing protein [Erysipelotrichaceae bacterium]